MVQRPIDAAPDVATESARRYRITVDGLRGLYVASEAVVEMPPAATRAVPIRLRVPPGSVAGGSQKIWFNITAEDGSGIHVREQAAFLSPKKEQN